MLKKSIIEPNIKEKKVKAMDEKNLDKLREEIDAVNLELLRLISRRGELVQEIASVKLKQGQPKFDPMRERAMLNRLIEKNEGPFDDKTVSYIFKEVFKASLSLQQEDNSRRLLVSRERHAENTVIDVGGQMIGDKPIIIAGPCAVESEEQIEEVAQELVAQGLSFIRAGAFKPRTSPYDFQGLGLEGLKILRRVADKYNLKVVSEIVSSNDMEKASEYVDVIQIGARNMQNYDLLKAAGQVRTPILLKRGISATIEELILAAEYIVSQGNSEVMLIERGIRTYERWTRNTLDILAVPILKQETHLPILVDISHSSGRKDIAIPTAKAALAAGADGIMVEFHPDPEVALSDASQQLNHEELRELLKSLREGKFI